MDRLETILSEQITSLKANYQNKPIKSGLLLVNYMPVMRVMQPYVEIDEDDLQFYEQLGFRLVTQQKDGKPYTRVPNIANVIGYAFVKDLIISKNTKLYVRFQPKLNSPDHPMIIKVNDSYYRNPNIVPINDVIKLTYDNSMFKRAFEEALNSGKINKNIMDYIFVNDMGREKFIGWEVSSDLIEIPCYNYKTSNFVELMKNLSIANTDFKLDTDLERVLNTHLFMCQTELGYLYTTFRIKSASFHTMDYCYNSEYVPIYFKMGINGILERTFSNNIKWLDILLNMFRPSDELLNKYHNVPDICKNIVMSDNLVSRDINGFINNNTKTGKSYYLTRFDLCLLGQITMSGGNGRRDTYNYRLAFPFLFDGLFKRLNSDKIPVYYSPNRWRVLFKENSGNMQEVDDYYDSGIIDEIENEEKNKSNDKLSKFIDINFDISSDNDANRMVNYDYFSYINFMNYCYPDNVNYFYNNYFNQTQSLSYGSIVEIANGSDNNDALQLIFNSYEEGFLKPFFTRS